jgi:hypothetical protein
VTKITRQPAGPGGPKSLMKASGDKLAQYAASVRGACRELIVEGIKPSITKVAKLSGRSISTINREPYTGILRAGRACYDLVSTGVGYAEAVALVGEYLPRKNCNDQDQADVAASSATVQSLRKKVARLEAEVERRDNQLYYTLGLVSDLRRRLRWHRSKLRDVNLQIEALTATPLPARTPRVWQEDLANIAVSDLFDDDEDDE